MGTVMSKELRFIVYDRTQCFNVAIFVFNAIQYDKMDGGNNIIQCCVNGVECLLVNTHRLGNESFVQINNTNIRTGSTD